MATFHLTGPDGGVYEVEAPDENAAAQAGQTLWAGQSAQQSSNNPQSSLTMAGKAIGAGAIGTLGGLPRTLANIYNYLSPEGTSKIPDIFPSSEESVNRANDILKNIHGKLVNFGLANPNADVGLNPKPQGSLEQAAVGGFGGIGGGLATGAVSAPSTIASAAGGIAGQLAAYLGIGSTGQVLAGAAGGYGAGVVSNVIKTAQIARNVDNLTQSLAQAKSSLADSLAAKPGALGQIKADVKAQVQNVVDSARALKDAHINLANSSIEDMAALHGASQTWEEAGNNIQDWARKWLGTTLQAKNKADFAPVDEALPPDTPSGLPTLASTLKDINEKGGELAPLIQAIGPKLPPKIQDIFSSITKNPNTIKGTPAKYEGTGVLDDNGEEIQKLVSPAIPDKPITWGSSGQLQQHLGDLLSDPTVLKDLGQQNANRIYGAVLNDREQTASANGVGNEFVTARQNAENRFNFAEGPIAKIIAGVKPTSEDPLPGDMAKKLIMKGATDAGDLLALKNEGAPIGELTAAALRQGKETNTWTKLAPQTKAVLTNDTGQGLQIVPNLDIAHQLLKVAPKEANDTIKSAIGQINQSKEQQVAAIGTDITSKKKNINDVQNQLMVLSPQEGTANPYRSQEDIAKAVSNVMMKHIGQSLLAAGATHALGGSLPIDLLAGVTPEVLAYLKSRGVSSGLTPVIRGAIGGNSLTP